jgi:hypothetical protein
MAEFDTAEGRNTAGRRTPHARQARRPWAWAWTLPCRTGRSDTLGSGSHGRKNVPSDAIRAVVPM